MMVVLFVAAVISALGWIPYVVLTAVIRARQRRASAVLFDRRRSPELSPAVARHWVCRVTAQMIRDEMCVVIDRGRELHQEMRRLTLHAKRLAAAIEEPELRKYTMYQADAGPEIEASRRRVDAIIREIDELKVYSRYLTWLLQERVTPCQG